MSLENLDLDLSYESDVKNLARRFYSPVLAKAQRYDRITAFFGSSSFITAGSGLEEFLEGGGKIRLIFDYVVSERDKEIMEGEIEEDIIKSIDEVQEEGIVENHLALFAWLLDEGRLEMKVARAKGTFHPKIGLVTDKQGNRISFSGSNNETMAGWSDNIETFKVFKSWEKGQKGYLQEDIDTFDRYWWDKSRKANIYDLDEAVKQKLLRHKPETKRELEEVKESIQNWREDDDIKSAEPRKYQSDAMDKWEEEEFCGIWKMATGTGKTWTAIWGLERLSESMEESLVTVIVVPYSHLANQWAEELKKFDYKPVSTLDYHSWEEEFEDRKMNLSMGIEKDLIVLTTYNKYIQKSFQEKIDSAKGKKLIIADEVHKAGATKFRKGLSDIYDYRLGLSATPSRHMDETGTKVIFDYFDGIKKEYGLKKAIGEGHLTDYEYKVDIVELTEEEREKYSKKTKKIASMLNSEELSENEQEALETLTRQRANIIKSAENKMETFQKIVENYEDFRKALVYCNDSEQVTEAMDILDKRHYKSHQFTKEENDEKRRKLAKRVKSGSINALVAMKCLDEGFNVPAIEKAVLVSSTRNPAQYIQRRGRVLREAEDKEYAIIHDLLVVPDKSEDYEPSGAEKKVGQKEMQRVKEFASTAKNSDEVMKDLNNVLSKYL